MSRSKHLLYLIDACYGGIATVGIRGLDAITTPNYIKKITKNKSRQIITAGGRDEQVIEKSEWGHSAFTKNINSGLKQANADINFDGVITANELGLYLSEKVTIDSDNKQTPQFGRMTSGEGEFIFIINDLEIINNQAVENTDEVMDSVLIQLKQNSEINVLLLQELKNVKTTQQNNEKNIQPVKIDYIDYNKAKKLSLLYPGLGHLHVQKKSEGIMWMILESVAIYHFYSSYEEYKSSKNDYLKTEQLYNDAISVSNIDFYSHQYDLAYDSMIIERNQLLTHFTLLAGVWFANYWRVSQLNKGDAAITLSMNGIDRVQIKYNF